MTRADLIVNMAKAAGWPKAGTERALRAMLIAIRASLKRGDPVTLVGFGTFSVARRRPRTPAHHTAPPGGARVSC